MTVLIPLHAAIDRAQSGAKAANLARLMGLGFQVPAGVVVQPIYLHVPPGHAKKWHKHCHKYHACDQPVFFVQDVWYNEEYVPRYREIHGKGKYKKEKGHKHK